MKIYHTFVIYSEVLTTILVSHQNNSRSSRLFNQQVSKAYDAITYYKKTNSLNEFLSDPDSV